MATRTIDRSQGAPPNSTGGPQPQLTGRDARDAGTERLPDPLAGPQASSLTPDVRPRAGKKVELRRRDKIMAWSFVLALLVLVALLVLLGR
jgi:hypothetical protein